MNYHELIHSYITMKVFLFSILLQCYSFYREENKTKLATDVVTG
jgi:hypothetical protein